MSSIKDSSYNTCLLNMNEFKCRNFHMNFIHFIRDFRHDAKTFTCGVDVCLGLAFLTLKTALMYGGLHFFITSVTQNRAIRIRDLGGKL